MKKVVLLDPAVAAMRKHRNMAERIAGKLTAYAENPASVANQVTELRGQPFKRLRVGDFRVLFEETETEIIVSDIGPRGSIYK
ncbi:MAG: type II toxin-antitoxin system RelE/ParE family toxin [Roseiarcus sp.]|jgi:mRNA interferase RelE/StbE